MDKHEESRTWLKFFKDAGIPKKTGATYAHIFVENRIHDDMLPELTVDYLRLMGITLMGDIIAILRHCKSVHQDSVRRVVFLQSKDEERNESSSSGSSSDGSSEDSSDESSDDVEMVEVIKTSDKRISGENIKKEPGPVIEPKQMKSQIVGKIVPSKQKTVSVIEKKSSSQPVKRKHDDEYESNSQEEPTSKTVISSNSGKSILKSAASAVKSIRVTTEQDTMGPKLPPPKKNVFERLGAETEPPQVSSTTEVLPVETTFTRIVNSLPNKSVLDEDTVTHKASSVFNRLGGLADSPPETKTVGPVLPYAGVLKGTPIIKRPIRPLNRKIGRGTMRADEPDIPVKIRGTMRSHDEPDGPIKIRGTMRSHEPDSPIKIRGTMRSDEPDHPIKIRGTMRSDESHVPIKKRGTMRSDEPNVPLKIRGTMRADEQDVPVKLRASRNLSQNNFTISIGENSLIDRRKPELTKASHLRQKHLNVGSQGIFAGHSQPPSVSVKQRLGLGEVSSTSSTKQAIRRQHSSIEKRRSLGYNKDDDDHFVSRSLAGRVASKKVSFGKVVRKFIGSLHSSGPRSRGILSRLGPTRRHL